VVFISVLVAGVLALIAAAAITLLSDNHREETESKEKEAQQNTPVTDPSDDFQLSTPVTFETTNPGESLRALVREVRGDASKRDALRPRALAAVNGLAALPLAEITPFADDIRSAADAWRMPEAWLALAAITTDEDKRLEHYLQAATLGNVRARTYAGAVQLNKGVASRDAKMIGLAVDQLSKAVAEGDADAMLILGDAMYEARGLVQDRKNGRIYVEQAAAMGHEGAKEWLKARPVK
jgi:TPR repeat protein